MDARLVPPRARLRWRGRVRRTARVGVRRVVLALGVSLALLATTACETAPADVGTTFTLVNEARSQQDRAALLGNMDLILEADRWAQHMRDTCRLAHRSDLWAGTPGGSTMVAENVGVVPHVTGDPVDALVRMHDGFMGSSGHRANILDRRLTHVGIGAVQGNCGVTGAPTEYWVVHIFVRLP